MQASPERLPRRARRTVIDPKNELLLSAVSSWEIAIKYALGKLQLPVPPGEYVPSRMSDGGVAALAVQHHHALRVAELPPHHRDPFDRLLIAQAQVEGVPIVTADPQFSAYQVKVVWT